MHVRDPRREILPADPQPESVRSNIAQMVRVLGVAHVGINARDPSALAHFYHSALELPVVLDRPGAPAILALGPTTDLFLMTGESTPVDFDLAVDDVEALRARLIRLNVPCTELLEERISGHRSFSFTDPEHNSVAVRTAHQRPVTT